MPALSSTMKEGRVVSWLKNEGDEIEAGEAIMVVESDKADMDVEAFEDGFLAKIIVGEGEMAPVGEAVALIAATQADIAAVAAGGAGGGAAVAAAAAAAAPPAAAAAAAPAASSGKSSTWVVGRVPGRRQKEAVAEILVECGPSLTFHSPLLPFAFSHPYQPQGHQMWNTARSICRPYRRL